MNNLFFNPKHIIFKAIAVIVCVCFLWQDVIWAAGPQASISASHLRQRQFVEQQAAKTAAGAVGIDIAKGAEGNATGVTIAIILAVAIVGGALLYIATLGVLYASGILKRSIWPFGQISRSQARLFQAEETIKEKYPSQPGAYSKLIDRKIKAIEFLEKYPDRAKVEALLDIASDDEVPAVQYRAHQALIKLGFPAAQDSIYCNYDNISIRQAAEQITVGLEDPEDRILAISRWVQENIVFEFVDFEAPASATLASKRGTCYHATNLQVALLRAMDFRARFIITRFRNEVFRELVPPSYYKTLGELSPHVYCEILYLNDWYRFDVVQDKNLRPSSSEGHVSHEGVYPLDVESGRELKRYDSLDKFIARGSRRVMQQKVPYLEEINSHIVNKFGELSIYDLFQQVVKEIGQQQTSTAGPREKDSDKDGAHQASAGGEHIANAGGGQAASYWYMPDTARQELLIKYGVYTREELDDLASLYRLYLWNGELSTHQKVLVWTYMILMKLDKSKKFASINDFINENNKQSEIQDLYIGYEWPAAMSLRKRLRIARRTIRKVKSVIEIGCTNGDVLFRLALERPGTNFLGLDASPYNIRAAVEKVAKKRKPPENLRFQVRDCRPAVNGVPNRGIPRPNKKAGAVLIIEGVMDSDEYPQQWKDEIAREALRVLKAGGRIGFIGIYGAEEIRLEAVRLGFTVAPDKVSRAAYHRLLRGIGGDYETGKLGKVAGFVWRVEKAQASAGGTGATAGGIGRFTDDLAGSEAGHIVEQAIKANLGYPEGIRPKDRKGSPGGLLKLSGVGRVAHISDLHGRCQNLLDIINDNDNLEALERGVLHLVITGDIIHHRRGDFRRPESYEDSVEALWLVIKLKARFPDNVHILMGSHELGQIFGPERTIVTNFRRRIEERFGQTMYAKVKRFLESLPVAAIVEMAGKRILFTHAGILKGIDEDAFILSLARPARLRKILNWPEGNRNKISAALATLGVDIMVTGHFHCNSWHRAEASPYKETKEDGLLTVVSLPQGRVQLVATQEAKQGPIGYIYLTAANIESMEGIFRKVSVSAGASASGQGVGLLALYVGLSQRERKTYLEALSSANSESAAAGATSGTARDAAIAEAVGRAERRRVAMLLALATAFISLCEQAKSRIASQKTALIIDADELHAERVKQTITLGGSREFKEIVILINPSQVQIEAFLMQKDVDLVVNYGYNIAINSYRSLGLFLIQPDISTNLNTIGEQVEDWLVEQCV